MSFIRRELTAIISIGGGQYGTEIEEVITVKNCRMSVDININGGESMGEMNCRIFGLSLALMNRLTTIGAIMQQIRFKNLIQIDATDENGVPRTIFTGNIATAYADMNSAPDVSLIIQSYSGGGIAIRPQDPISYSAPVSVDQVMRDLAQKAGLTSQNHGVDGIMLDRPYLKGSLLDMIRKVAQSAMPAVNYSIENGILSYWKVGGNLTDPEQIISPGKNMVGYPTYASSNVIVNALFMPFARLGSRIKIEGSELTPVNQTWTAFQVAHQLDSITPNGRWFTSLLVGKT